LSLTYDVYRGKSHGEGYIRLNAKANIAPVFTTRVTDTCCAAYAYYMFIINRDAPGKLVDTLAKTLSELQNEFKKLDDYKILIAPTVLEYINFLDARKIPYIVIKDMSTATGVTQFEDNRILVIQDENTYHACLFNQRADITPKN
jgi:hypothetical protein